jgi:phosphoglycolate phosphatase
MRSVIFDLDGTLADTSGDLLAAANACFRAMGHGDVLGAGDAGVALRGGKMMLRTGFERLGIGDAALIDRWYPELLSAYGAALDHHTVLYPGALEAVAALKARGYGVGICTNKPAALAEALMVSLAARDAFGALVGADTLPVRKPDPRPLVETVTRLGGDPARTCLVGDSVTDRETARAAGVPSILVTFGPSGDDMAALAPEALLERFEDLPDLVERLVA